MLGNGFLYNGGMVLELSLIFLGGYFLTSDTNERGDSPNGHYNFSKM